MKTRFIIFSILVCILVAIGENTIAQCPWKKVNCTGHCGRHVDNNNNNICDLSEVQATVDTPIIVKQNLTSDKKEVSHKKEVVSSKKKCDDCTHKKCLESESSKSDNDLIESKVEGDDEFKSIDETEIDTATASKTTEVKAPEEKPKPYSLIFISALTLGLYLLSWLAIKMKLIKLSNHRKIWNVLLLLTFLVSCLFGFFLVIQINYDFVLSWYRTVLYWHVQVGIGMTIVAVIHAIWHTKYYVKIFVKKDPTKIIHSENPKKHHSHH
jgi:cation transport ATPase